MRDKALQVWVSGGLSGSLACWGDGIISLDMVEWLLRGICRHWSNHGRRRPAGQKRGVRSILTVIGQSWGIARVRWHDVVCLAINGEKH